MYAREQIYDRLKDGTAATKMTSFTEPSSGPGSSMHKLDEAIAGVPGVTAEWWAAVQEEIRQDMARAAASSSGSAHWTDTGETAGDKFGYSVGTAGDVNDDGYADLVVGAYGYGSSTGKVYVYYGGPSGLSTSADWTATGDAGDWFGYSVGTAGDVNGDSKADLVVGAYGRSSFRGKAYVYHGSGSGLSLSSDWTATGEGMNNYFGRSVGTAGDVNSDGYADLVVGADGHSDKGKAYVYLGSGSGLSSPADWTAAGETAGDHFGYSVGTAGDVNGDGKADLVVGAYGYDGSTGKAYVYHGNPLDSPAAPDSEAAQMVTLEQIYDRLATGAAPTKMTTFTEPAAGPPVLGRGEMHTLDEIMAKAYTPVVVEYGEDCTGKGDCTSTACCPSGTTILHTGMDGVVAVESGMTYVRIHGLVVYAVTDSSTNCGEARYWVRHSEGYVNRDYTFRAFVVCDPND
jgi:hypothetical protein